MPYAAIVGLQDKGDRINQLDALVQAQDSAAINKTRALPPGGPIRFSGLEAKK